MIDKQLENKIDQFIKENKDKLLDDIFSVVSIKSVSTRNEGGYPFGIGCHEVLEKALSLAQEYGLKIKNCNDYCGYALLGNNGGKKIGIFSHMDVVPEGSGWYNEPYKPIYKDGFLVGRGVSDNKGSGMYSLHALRFFKENNINLKHDVLLYFGCSEETGMEDIEYFTSHEDVPFFSLVPDSRFPVCYGEKGILRFDLQFKIPSSSKLESITAGLVVNSIPAVAEATFSSISEDACRKLESMEGISVLGNKVKAFGIATHAAFPEGSKNAINILVSALLKSNVDPVSENLFVNIENLTSEYNGASLDVKMEDSQSGALTVVGTILRESKGLLTLSFDMRYPVTIKGCEIIEKLKFKAASFNADFILKEDSAPAYTPIDSEEVQTLCKVAEYVQKVPLEPYTMGGGTYARKLPFAVGFGPGMLNAPNLYGNGRGGGHQCDENILFDLLLKGMKATIIALIELDKIIN